MSTLRQRLMLREALQRLDDARALATSNTLGPFSNSSHLLSLLGFELLLKLVYETVLGDRAPGHHRYHEIFDKLPEAVQTDILVSARDRIGPSSLNNDVQAVLKEWGSNFIALRYPYEKYEGKTEAEYRNLGEEWVAQGAPLEDALFRFHPEELFGMLYALRAVAERMANSSS